MLVILLFLLAAALLPPAFLLGVVYRMDKVEREPPRLLLALFVRGVGAMVPILVLELVADQFVEFFPWGALTYLFLSYFLIPGLIEEGMKYRVLVGRTWWEPNFNYTFDGVVYAVFVSLGFAAVENVSYVLSDPAAGFQVAVVRALFSIPGHALFGGVMGMGYGRAKALTCQGQAQRGLAVRRRALFAAVVLHGLYDFLLMAFPLVFYPYFLLLVIIVGRRVKRAAREDGPVGENFERCQGGNAPFV